jgi:hypothetical protein
LRHQDPKKSAAISSAVSMLSVAATLKALGKGSNWAPLTYLKVGAMQIALLGGVFDQPKLYDENGKLKYHGEIRGRWFDGQGKKYDENGKLRYEGGFKQGMFHGQGKLYRTNGELDHDGEFRDSKPVKKEGV